MAKRWDEVVASGAFQALSFDEQDAARRQYFDAVVVPRISPEERDAAWSQFDSYTSKTLKKPEAPASGLPSLSDAEITDSTPERATPALPERSWSEAAVDTGISLRKGAGSALQAAGFLADMANPSLAIQRMAGGTTFNKEFSKSIDGVVAELEEGYSEKRKAQGKAYDKVDGFTESALFLLQNPSFVGDQIAESAVGTVAAGGAGRLAGNIALRASAALEKKIAQQAAEKGAAWASGAAEAAQTFGQVAEDIEASLDKNGVTDAGQRVAAMSVSLPAALATLAFGRMGGNVEGKLFGGAFKEEGGNVASRIAKDVLKEGVLEEMPQSVTEQLATNIGQRAAGDNVEITDGLGKAAASGLVVGAAQGGGISAFNEVKTASRIALTGDFKTDIAAIAAAPVTPVVQPSQTPQTPQSAASPAPVVSGVGVTGQDAAAVTTPSAVQESPLYKNDVQADILRASDGKPFGAKTAAELEAKDRGLVGYEAVQIGEEQFVLRPRTVDSAAHEAATSPKNDKSEPTDGQKGAGNYELGHTRVGAIPVSVENPHGSTRSGTDANGKPWSQVMNGHYGYVKGSLAADKDAKGKPQKSDINVSEGTPEDYTGSVFVVDQVKEDGSFDEHKAYTGVGIDSVDAARAAYRSNYAKGWDRDGAITEMSQADYLAMVRDTQRSKLPVDGRIPLSSAPTNPLAEAPATASVSTPEKPQDVAADQQDVTSVSVLNDVLRAEAGARGAEPTPVALSKRALPDAVHRLGKVLGKRVVAIETTGIEGVVLRKSLPGVIFVNTKAKVSPAAIVGHEIVHLIRAKYPDIYRAAAKAIAAEVDGQGHLADWRARAGAKDKDGNVADPDALEMSGDAVFEELMADLDGNRLTEKSTWGKLAQRAPKEFRQFAQLVIDKFNEFIGRAKKYKDADAYVIGDMERVRDALVQMLAEYSAREAGNDARAEATQRGDGQAGEGGAGSQRSDDLARSGAVSAESSRPASVARDVASGAPAGGSWRSRVPRGLARSVGANTPVVAHGNAPGAVAVVAWHYGKAADLTAISANRFGSGMKAEEAARVSRADPAVKRRVNFYVQRPEKMVPPPESGVGPHVYRTVLANLLDTSSDQATALWKPINDAGITDRDERLNAFEKAVIDAGYDGIYNEYADVAYTLGLPAVEAEFLGYRSDAMDAAFSRSREEDFGVNVEVAPNPDNVELSKRFAALPYAKRKAITQAVADAILPRVAASLGLAPPQIEYTVGGFEGASSPSLIVRSPGATMEQLNELALAMGRVLRQKAVISYDESITTGENVTGFVSVLPSRELTEEEVDALYQHIRARYPTADGYTYRRGKLVFGNFSSEPDTQFHARIDGALAGFELEGVTAQTALHRFYSEWMGTANEGDQTQAGAGGEALRGQPGGVAALRRDAEAQLEKELARAEGQKDVARSRAGQDDVDAVASREGGEDGRGRQGDGRAGEADDGSLEDLFATVGGGRPARGWATATRARGTSGQPLRLFRGERRALGVADFDEGSLGVASGNPSSGLGVWFTSGKDEAAGYGNLREVFLDIRKPKLYTFDALPAFDTLDEARALRRSLQAQGFDSIVIHGRNLGKPEVHFVAFKPEQVVIEQEQGDLDFTDAKFSRQSPPDSVVEAYSYGKCMWFAIAAHDRHGWPIEAIFEDGAVSHAWVRMPDGRSFDISGPNGAEDFIQFGGSIRKLSRDAMVGIVGNNVREIARADQVLQRYYPDVGSDLAYSRTRTGDTISTRNPTAVKASENPVDNLLTVDLDTMKRDPALFEQNVRLLTKYPNMQKGGKKSTARIAEEFVAHVVDNLLWLYDQVPAPIRERSKLWYVGANKIARDFAKEYGVSPKQAAGILASLSPQKDWFQNVDLARRVMDILKNEQNRAFTPDMGRIAKKVLPAAFDKSDPKKHARQLALLKAVQGKKLSALTDNVERAAWVRLYDEAHNSRAFPVVTPEGDFSDPVQTVKGADRKVAWNDFNTIAKAVSIFYTDSIEHISATLGEEHKVRSFYNNIIDPMSEDGHVTIDTHAVAAGLLRPLAGKSIEVLHNFGNTLTGQPGPAGSKITGLSGTYAIYAEAYRRAAAARGVLAREMQSITWEAVRGLFPEVMKLHGQSQLDTIAKAWQDYNKGKASLNETRQRTLEAAGGIQDPDWVGVPAAGLDAEAGDRADAGSVSRSGVPGRDAGVDGGAGSSAAPAAAEADVAFSRSAPDTPEFRAWFGDSRVVDKDGNPLVVYHGTSADEDFTEFSTESRGAWFTANAREASNYARNGFTRGAAPRVIPAYLSISNPYIPTMLEDRAWRNSLGNESEFHVVEARLAAKARKLGHDGIYLAPYWVALEPTQIKSAIGNSGAFDPSNADIAFSRTNTMQRVRDHLEAALNTKRTFNWWDRTVGTQINKARKSPEFKRVFDKANEFIRDVSFFAAEAADRAPNLLPKLESMKTMGKGFIGTMTGERQKTLKAVGQALYAGTLAKTVYTDQELQRMGLTPEARMLYSEARGAVEKSLEQTATSTIHRLARAMKLGVPDVREMTMMQARDAVTAVIRAKRDALASELANEQQLLGEKAQEYAKQLTPEALAATLKNHSDKVADLQRRHDEMVKAVDDVNDIAGRVIDLQNDGYFPLMRFGQYTVYATEGEGKDAQQLFFGMYETEADRVKMARNLRVMFPNAKVVEGIGNDEYYQLFAGINLDSLEVFAEAMGASEQAVFQSYLKLAVANRSALKRMIQRKEIAGFDTDVTRTLAHFLTSNARMASRNYHWAEAKAAAADIPKDKGDVQKEAVRLLGFIENPQEEAQTLRAMNFLWYLAGNLSTAILNMTQPFMTTAPYLSRFGVKEAGVALGKGAASVSPKWKPDAEMVKALKLAEEKGVTAPHEIHYLYGEQQRSLVSGDTRLGAIWRRGTRVIGEPFALAEAFNRRVTFVAAYEIGRKLTPAQLQAEGVKDAFGFAMKAVDDTQFVYHKANRPNWGRGSIQSLVFQFKTYSISSVELFAHLAKQGPEGRRAAAIMLAMWLLAAGMMGLPFEEDLEDAIDTLGQSLGFDTNVRAAIRDNVTKGAEAILGETLGKYAAEFMLHGVSGVLPLDVQARLSLGNMVPATGVGKRANADNRGRELAEILGPTGGVINSMFEALDAFQSGDGLATVASPNFIKNVAQAVDMMQTGTYRDAGGRSVVKTDTLDWVVKMLGFQPSTVAREQRKLTVINEMVKLQRVAEKDFAERAAKALARAAMVGTPEAGEKAERELEAVYAGVAAWNERNPDTPVVITQSQIKSRVKQMMMERSARMLKSTPREMRGIIAGQMEDDE
jgi:hypothetical protein